MGRGNLFFVCKKSLADFEYYDENSFDLEDAASLHLQWVEATDPATSKADLKNLYDLLKSSGFKVIRAGVKASLDAFFASEDGDVYSKTEFKRICSFVLFTGLKRDCDAAKKAYFQMRLDELKEKVAALTLDMFAGVEQFSPYDITSLVDDDYYDVVHMEESGFMTFDAFIRGLEPERVYFFGAKVMWMK